MARAAGSGSGKEVKAVRGGHARSSTGHDGDLVLETEASAHCYYSTRVGDVKRERQGEREKDVEVGR